MRPVTNTDNARPLAWQKSAFARAPQLQHATAEGLVSAVHPLVHSANHSLHGWRWVNVQVVHNSWVHFLQQHIVQHCLLERHMAQQAVLHFMH